MRTHHAMFWWRGCQWIAVAKPGRPWTLSHVHRVMHKRPRRAWWLTGFRREAIRALLTAPHSRKALPVRT